MKFTVITKDGQKWLTLIPSKPIWGNEKEWMEEVLSEDLPYIGSHPEGTAVYESEVREVRQYRQIGAGLDWTTCPSEQVEKAATDRPSFELRTAYTDVKSHDRHISDDYWHKRCEAAERYISESPCDPDITKAQRAAYEAWQEFVKQAPNENI